MISQKSLTYEIKAVKKELRKALANRDYLNAALYQNTLDTLEFIDDCEDEND